LHRITGNCSLSFFLSFALTLRELCLCLSLFLAFQPFFNFPQEKLNERVETEIQKFLHLNNQKSVEKTKQLIDRLFSSIEDKRRRDVYSVPGGFQKLGRAVEEMKARLE
jgi:hypothetical protein